MPSNHPEGCRPKYPSHCSRRNPAAPVSGSSRSANGASGPAANSSGDGFTPTVTIRRLPAFPYASLSPNHGMGNVPRTNRHSLPPWRHVRSLFSLKSSMKASINLSLTGMSVVPCFRPPAGAGAVAPFAVLTSQAAAQKRACRSPWRPCVIATGFPDSRQVS